MKTFNLVISVCVAIELPCESAFDAKSLVKNGNYDALIAEGIIQAGNEGEYEIDDVEKQ